MVDLNVFLNALLMICMSCTYVQASIDLVSTVGAAPICAGCIFFSIYICSSFEYINSGALKIGSEQDELTAGLESISIASLSHISISLQQLSAT